MDNVLSARALMGISLGFHIIYATIGIGLPAPLLIALIGINFRAAAAPPATLCAFFAVLVIGIIILAPSLLLLYGTFRGEPNPELPS